MQLLENPLLSIVTAGTTILISVVYYIIKNRKILPGPWGLPYLGIYPFLKDETCHLQFEDNMKKYGDVFSFTICGKLFIHLGSIKAMREVNISKAECFSSRYTDFSFLTYAMEDGLTMANGEPWAVLRKFFIQNFKEYGITAMRENMIGPVYDSVASIIEDLKSRGDEPFNVLDILAGKCSVSIRKILFGEDGISDESIRDINKAYGSSLEGSMGRNLILMGPFARLIYYINPKLRQSLNQQDFIKETLLECVKRIESNMDDKHPMCIIESYYSERNKRRCKNDATWKIFTDKALVASLNQFVGDGIIGVAAFIAGFLNNLILYPEEQEKIHAELMDVVGLNREIQIEDKSNLPYTTAFMHEVLRTSTFLPFFPSLQCTRETTLNGYRIPEGAITLLNFWAAHRDPNIYEDPDTFNPSRFMNTPGKSRSEHPITFGVGKRSCSGEAFVMMQAFLFLTTIVKNFKIVRSNVPTDNSAAFLLAGRLEICVQPRSEK